jgi:hypothetical protein
LYFNQFADDNDTSDWPKDLIKFMCSAYITEYKFNNVSEPNGFQVSYVSKLLGDWFNTKPMYDFQTPIVKTHFVNFILAAHRTSILLTNLVHT